MGQTVPGGGTNGSPPLSEAREVVCLEGLVETDLNAGGVAVNDVADLRLQLRVYQAFAVLIAVVGALAAQEAGQLHADAGARVPVGHILVDGGNAFGHRHLLILAEVLTRSVAQGAGQYAVPLRHCGRHLPAGLMAEAVLGHRAVLIGAHGPPVGYVFIVYHTAKVRFFGQKARSWAIFFSLCTLHTLVYTKITICIAGV